MRIAIRSALLSAALILPTAACFSHTPPDNNWKDVGAGLETTGLPPEPTPTPPDSKKALESTAHEYDLAASEGKVAEAYEFYSQRCKDILDLDSYRTQLEQYFEGRDPDYVGVEAGVEGTKGWAVPIDMAPDAPRDELLAPREWTFIDGRWQLDHC